MTNKYDESINATCLESFTEAQENVTVIVGSDAHKYIIKTLKTAAYLEEHKDELRALVNAGDKATQGDMDFCWEEGKHGVIADCSKKLVAIVGNSGNPKDPKNDERKANCKYWVKAANTRPILKELLEGMD